MTPEQQIEALQMEQIYRRELIHAVNVFPHGASLQDIVDNAVFLQGAVHAIQTSEPVATITRYATVTEVIAPPESEDDDAVNHP